ncbi:glycogen synthase [Escherichia coli]|uniref:starch synthase n=1 Tax=Escherichia coli TaxID=562 RepID=A0A484Y506_ECOLX|nr:glycogen synthase [Escherichia coli]
MQVLHVCSEMFPLLKTGGLADVIGHYPQHKSQTALTLAYCCLHSRYSPWRDRCAGSIPS